MAFDGAYVPTIEETVTATHPPVIPLKPVRTGHPAVRVPGTEENLATPDATGSPSVDNTDERAALTRTIFKGVLIGLRISAITVLALVAYIAWDHNWVGQAADAAVTWYTTTVAPYLEVDFVGPEVPTVQDGLVGPMNEPSLVVTD